MKKALLIGIDYIKIPDITLNGCINDTINIKNSLIDAYDYDINNITMLRDDETRPVLQPTRENIINNLKSLALQSGSLEEIWIHYSGHGSQLRDKNNDEVSGYDSILVPIDYKTGGFIVDDELLNIIKNIKCRTILIFDSCHSGTICDLPWSFEYKNENTCARTKNNNIVIQNPNIYMFSGCKDTQTSADSYNNDKQQYVGAFTDALLYSLRLNRHNVPFMILYRDICKHLSTNNFTQFPIFSSSNPSPTYTFTRALKISKPVTNTTPINTTKNIIRRNMKSLIL
jgi:hypothetical protein